MLDLKVLAPDKAQVAVIVVVAEVARLVNNFVVTAVERILHKCFCRFQPIVVISKRQRRTAYEDFADGIVCRQAFAVVI